MKNPQGDPLAKCRGRLLEQFYPSTHQSGTVGIRVCKLCPIRVDCLEWAIAHNETHGIWGGVTANDRARMQDRREQLRRFRRMAPSASAILAVAR